MLLMHVSPVWMRMSVEQMIETGECRLKLLCLLIILQYITHCDGLISQLKHSVTKLPTLACTPARMMMRGGGRRQLKIW